ncbi:hypothetical protein N869_05765, partial [Cellulomonas bogoriensis 69B4 = DSM 16987]
MAALTDLDARSLGTVRRYFALNPVAADVLVVACFVLPELIAPFVGASRPVSLLLVGLGAVVLMARRHRPVPVAGAIGLLAVVGLAWTGSLNGYDLAVGFAVYAVAAARPPRVAWLTTATLVAAVAWAAWLWERPGSNGTLTFDGSGPPSDTTVRIATLTGLTVISLVAMAIGVSVRQRRLHVADLVERAARLEAERDQQARLARAEERGRIAREMHDV